MNLTAMLENNERFLLRIRKHQIPSAHLRQVNYYYVEDVINNQMNEEQDFIKSWICEC